MKQQIDISQTRRKALMYNLERHCTEDCTYKSPFDNCTLRECIRKTGKAARFGLQGLTR